MSNRPYGGNYNQFKYWINNDCGGMVNVDSADVIKTPRNIYGNSFDGSNDLNQVIQPLYGGTGLSLYAIGDLLVATATNILSKISAVAAGNAFISNGVGVLPSWGKINLTQTVSGILPIANGGTNSSTTLQNNRVIVSSAGALVETSALTNGQILIGRTGLAPVAATITAGFGITVSNNSGSITIATTSAPLNVFNHVTTYTLYTSISGTTLNLTPLTTSFDTSKVNQDVVIRVMLNYEAGNDAVFIIRVDGVEVGSSPAAGTRNVGIASLAYDADNVSTMANCFIQYRHTVAAIGTHSLTVHAKIATSNPTSFALNGVIGNNDAVNYERAASNVSIDYVVSASISGGGQGI